MKGRTTRLFWISALVISTAAGIGFSGVNSALATQEHNEEMHLHGKDHCHYDVFMSCIIHNYALPWSSEHMQHHEQHDGLKTMEHHWQHKFT